MANYVQTTFFTPKDTLPTTNPAKTIFGAAYDTEFGNIAAAIASKYDNTTSAPSLLSLTVGAPTGGNLGAGSINAQSISVNNIAVVTAVTGTANQIAASTTFGAVTLSLPQNIVIPTPVSGIALTVTAVSGGIGITVDTNAVSTGNIRIAASGFTGGTYGIGIDSGTAGLALGRLDIAHTSLLVLLTGGILINSPVSGDALTTNSTIGRGLVVSGGNNANVAELTAGATSGQSFGPSIHAGTTAGDFALRIGNQASTQSFLSIAGDGGVIAGAPTGGNQGLGTINAVGLFVNGGQLFFGVPASGSTTAAVTDVGKCINAAAGITVPNAVFSQGHAFSIYNNTAGAITITAGITTMRLAGTATTGNRTLAQRGIATIWFESGTECAVGGPGVS